MKAKKNRPTIENRKVHHNYFVEETIECGIVLKGNEIKSILAGKSNINEAWCSIENNQLILNNMYIGKYDTANSFDVSERRPRMLLAHKSEIRKLASEIAEKGYTLIPTKIFWDRQYVKVSVGVCKGKHTYDKRQSIKERDVKRDMDRQFSQY